MAQFLVLAYDGTDADALARRQATRGAHLESVRPMAENLFAAGSPRQVLTACLKSEPQAA